MYPRMRDYSARELHYAFTRDRWTQPAPLAKIRKHTTFNQSNLSVSSAVVNPLFSSMSKRAKESVKRTSPDTAIHEQNGYVKVHDDKYTFKTDVDNDNSDTTYSNMRNK